MTDTTITFTHRPFQLAPRTPPSPTIVSSSKTFYIPSIKKELSVKESESPLMSREIISPTEANIERKNESNNETTKYGIDDRLNFTFNLYYHLPNDKNWDFSSYKIIKSVSTIKEIVSLNENLPDNIIKYCMLFMMKHGIVPMWEDPRNINGGCFSYKVYNKNVVGIWKQIVYAFCGGTLMNNRENMKYVNGITISPKKNFCILKIWLENMKLQNPEEVITIENLSKTGVLFKPHTSSGG